MSVYTRCEHVGAVAAVGAVLGTIIAAIWRDFDPGRTIMYGEWAALSGALFGAAALGVEISRLVGHVV